MGEEWDKDNHAQFEARMHDRHAAMEQHVEEVRNSLSYRIDSVSAEVAKLSNSVDQMHELIRSVDKLATSVEQMAIEQGEQRTLLEKHDERMNKYERSSGDLAKRIVAFVCTAIGGGVIAWLLSLAGIVG